MIAADRIEAVARTLPPVAALALRRLAHAAPGEWVPLADLAAAVWGRHTPQWHRNCLVGALRGAGPMLAAHGLRVESRRGQFRGGARGGRRLVALDPAP